MECWFFLFGFCWEVVYLIELFVSGVFFFEFYLLWLFVLILLFCNVLEDLYIYFCNINIFGRGLFLVGDRIVGIFC